MTKAELREFRTKAKEVYQLEQEIDYLANLGPKISRTDKVLVDSGSGGSPTEETAEKIITLKEKYQSVITSYLAERIRIEKAFEQLTPNERTAMRYYYFDRLTWEQTAEQMGKTSRYVLSLHKWALIKIKNI